jgi:hypothetical protein
MQQTCKKVGLPKGNKIGANMAACSVVFVLFSLLNRDQGLCRTLLFCLLNTDQGLYQTLLFCLLNTDQGMSRTVLFCVLNTDQGLYQTLVTNKTLVLYFFNRDQQGLYRTRQAAPEALLLAHSCFAEI